MSQRHSITLEDEEDEILSAYIAAKGYRSWTEAFLVSMENQMSRSKVRGLDGTDLYEKLHRVRMQKLKRRKAGNSPTLHEPRKG